jgi:hypothetical protein
LKSLTKEHSQRVAAWHLGLDCFLPGKMILIDASGWSDLLLGVVICAVKPPDEMVLERRIPTVSFQPPNFKNKKYLDDAVKIADEIIAVMQADSETCFKVCSEFVLSNVIDHLERKGFKVEKAQSIGEVKRFAENAYVRWCIEKGVPREILEGKRRFWGFAEWVAENPHLREGLVKTGWASWINKWRDIVYQRKF